MRPLGHGIGVGVLILMTGCVDTDQTREPAAQAQAAPPASPVEAAVDEIEQRFGDSVVRVIATVDASSGSPSSVEAAQQRLVAFMEGGGAAVADPIPGQPLVVIECAPRLLEEAAQRGLLVSVQLDALDAPQ